MQQIKAVIFDMDGVLIDAKEWHYESLNKALALFGAEISRYDHLVTFDGLPTKKKLEMLSLEGGFPKKLHDFVNALKQQYTMEIVYAKCKPNFQHQYALARLKNENYKMAVCSNSVKATIEIMMQKADLMNYLNFIISNEDVQKSKPHPEMYVKAIQKLQLSPKECLVVEDNENGIKAALAAGAHLLKVENTGDVHYYNIINKINQINSCA
jgi:beta-phosphoglucomutase